MTPEERKIYNKLYREANAEATRLYQKEYREQNKNTIKNNKSKYYKANKEEILLSNKAYQEANKEKISLQQKEYNKLNKEKNKIYKNGYKKNNSEKIKDSDKKYYNSNKEKIKITQANYRKNNKEKIKASRRKSQEKRLNTDFLFKIKRNISRSISRIFNLKELKKSQSTIEILGCDIEHFKLYIESQFEPWMNWNNYGAYKLNTPRTWNIDHIIPISSAQTEEDIIRLNHYSNLRPLCSKENLDKRDKFM